MRPIVILILIVIVLLGIQAQKSVLRAEVESGVFCYLFKPLDLAQVVLMLERAAERYASIQPDAENSWYERQQVEHVAGVMQASLQKQIRSVRAMDYSAAKQFLKSFAHEVCQPLG